MGKGMHASTARRGGGPGVFTFAKETQDQRVGCLHPDSNGGYFGQSLLDYARSLRLL